MVTLWQVLLLVASCRASSSDDDLYWRDTPSAWHQQVARIIDHRFTTLDELESFALQAKQAGVSVVIVVQMQKTAACPGLWYNGLQLCDHINGSFPAADGTLERWQRMLRKIKPMRLMWWTNPAYWSTQGEVWAQASADKTSDIGSWFSWGPEDCSGVTQCAQPGVAPCEQYNVVVPGQGCAQGSWGQQGICAGLPSALASFGSAAYQAYMVDAYANSWTARLGIDGYTEDVSGNYPCMDGVNHSEPFGGGMPSWGRIMARVKELQPHVVASGEYYNSWEAAIAARADLVGQGWAYYHEAMQQAVIAADLSNVEDVAQASGADGATIVCYLHPAFDGVPPGRCPSLYFRDSTATIQNAQLHTMWVLLEAASGIVSQHDFDPNGTWPVKDPSVHGGGAWWNVTVDPAVPGETSPLWAFSAHRALNRLALRTKLNISSDHLTPSSDHLPPSTKLARTDGPQAPDGFDVYAGLNCSAEGACTPIDELTLGARTELCALRCNHNPACGCFRYGFVTAAGYQLLACQSLTNCTAPSAFVPSNETTTYVKRGGAGPLPTQANGALAYLKHDALGPAGDAALVLFNPREAQTLTVDLSSLPAQLMGQPTTDLLAPNKSTSLGPPLATSWRVQMGAGEVRAYGGFSLGSFAPRAGKVDHCVADDGFRSVADGHTLQACFLACLNEPRCHNVLIEHANVTIWANAPPLHCQLLGKVATPLSACTRGTGTLVAMLPDGRPRSVEEGRNDVD